MFEFQLWLPLKAGNWSGTTNLLGSKHSLETLPTPLSVLAVTGRDCVMCVWFHREQSKTSAFWCISSCRVQKGTKPGSHSSDLGMRHTGSGTRLCHFIHFQRRCLPPSPSPQIPLQPMGRQRQRRARFSCCRHLLGGDELHSLQAYFSLFECKGRLDKLLRWRCLLWEELIPA